MSVYAYADESGNTGANMFDPAQPTFYAVAVIAKFDVDAEFKRLFNGFARTEGFTHLHAAEMGLGRLSKIFRKLETRILRDDIRFFTAKIIKRDLVVAKVFDTVFDPHENKAVPWHAYWVREMRFIAMIKLNYIVTDEILRAFWGSLVEPSETKSLNLFKIALKALRPRVAMLPDPRSREIFDEAIGWALSYPAEIGFHMRKKKSGLAHLPNLTAFSPMLQEIDGRAEAWGTDVKVIKHDRESQIQALLRDWHQMLSNAREGTFSLFGKQFKSRVVFGSEFEISSSADSPGIQLADIVLWLMKKADERGSLGEPADSLLARVRSHAEPTELTIAYMISEAERMDQYVASQPLTEEDLQRGKKLVDEAEARRKRQMEAQPITAT
jgi:hypothetical protein